MRPNEYLSILIIFFLLYSTFVYGQDECQLFKPPSFGQGSYFKGCFTQGDQSFFFFKKVDKGESYRIFESRMKNNQWSQPDTIAFGEAASDLYPAISPDGNYMAFASYRKVNGVKVNAYLWLSKREGDAWSAPVFLKQLNQEGKYHSNVYFDGNRLVYRVTESDWERTTTFVSEFEYGVFSSSIPYDPVERWKNWRDDVYLWGGAPGLNDSSVVLDVSVVSESGEKSKSDQWIAFKKNGKWAEPYPLPKCVNEADSWDTHIFYNGEKTKLFFVRDFKEYRFISTENLISVN